MTKAIGIYFVIGYGTDCDGAEAFKCDAFVSKHLAEAYCDSCNYGSDGVQYTTTSDMAQVYDYCESWSRAIPLASLDDDQKILVSYTAVDYLSNF
jgi:hypothetical protein